MSQKPAKDGVSNYEKVGEIVSIFCRDETWYVNCQHNGRQIRRSLKTKSKKEARSRALAIERDIVGGQYKTPKEPALLKDAIADYTNNLRSENRSPKTIGKYTHCLAILSEIAESRKVTRISQIDLGIVDRYRAARVAGDAAKKRKPARPKTVHNDTVIIRQLVNFALKRGMLAEDPLAELVIEKPRRTPQPCWSRSQVEAIITIAKPPYEAPLKFLADTGARVGELKWLTWDDVDLERRLIHIRPKEGWKPKSGDERVIPMSERLAAMFQSMPKKARWVFTARVTALCPNADRQISERRMLQYLKRLLKKLGLAGHVHTFRHSFISFAACEGVPERVLRAWIGHVDPQILAWYFHLADKQSQEAMKKLTGRKEIASQQITDSISAQNQHKSEGDSNARRAS